MQNTEKPCRHEYVKIFQRRYKDFGRRMVSTRGYLPTGFSNKDFSFLTAGAYCFCSTCRKRLFPNRADTTKTAAANLLSAIPTLSTELPADPLDNYTVEENATTPESSSQEIDVEELLIEQTDVTDLIDKAVIVNPEEDIESAEGEE